MYHIDDFAIVERKDSQFDFSENFEFINSNADEEFLIKDFKKNEIFENLKKKNYRKNRGNKKVSYEETENENGNENLYDNLKFDNDNEKINLENYVKNYKKFLSNKNKIRNNDGNLNSNFNKIKFESKKIMENNPAINNINSIPDLNKNNIEFKNVSLSDKNELLMEEKFNKKTNLSNPRYSKINSSYKKEADKGKFKSFKISEDKKNRKNSKNFDVENSNEDKSEKKEKNELVNTIENEENSEKNGVNNLPNFPKNIEMTQSNFNKKKKQGYKNCLFCKDDIPKHLPILRFKSSEEFILYSSYFYGRLIGDKINLYKESKIYFDNYYNNYYKKCSQSNNFFFKSIKYICLKCYESNLIPENGFSNILNTLQYGINPGNMINFANPNSSLKKIEDNKPLSDFSQIENSEENSFDDIKLLKRKKKFTDLNNGKLNKFNQIFIKQTKNFSEVNCKMFRILKFVKKMK